MALNVRKVIAAAATKCTGCGFHHHHDSHPSPIHAHRASSTTPVQKEYAFEMAASTVRFGRGVTREIGYDFEHMGAKKVLIVTDPNIAKMPVMQKVVDSLTRSKVAFDVFEGVRVEPTDTSFKAAIDYAIKSGADAFAAVGGGSAMDTAKAANLYSTHRDFDFLDFVNAPIGKGLAVPGPVKPLIAVPTTAGTGSETTGVAIFDYVSLKTKTGIGSRVLKPTLGIIDPDNTDTMPWQVAAASGFDVLCHALESYTAISYLDREPRPAHPKDRPTYQGSNPMSDVWSLQALRMLSEHFIPAVTRPDAVESRERVLLAATFAGVGFGNAGVHLCHGLSYPISGLNKHLNHVKYVHPGYDPTVALVPHGVSVVITAPAVFRFTAPSNVERHLAAAQALGADISNVASNGDAAGHLLADTIMKYIEALRIPRGLKYLGYTSSDIPELVKGALPQQRVLKIAPCESHAAALTHILENSLSY